MSAMKRSLPPASSPRAAQAARTSDSRELDALCRQFPAADVAIVDAVLREFGASAAATKLAEMGFQCKLPSSSSSLGVSGGALREGERRMGGAASSPSLLLSPPSTRDRPSQTPASDRLPWIFVHAPQRAQGHRHHDEGDLEPALAAGASYLAKLAVVCGENQAQRGQRALRELHDIAQRYRVTCGKWMLFFTDATVDAAWATIAAATERGELGHSSKVATNDGSNSYLVCVYVPDFTDRANVSHVLRRLRELGFGWKLNFKTDFITHMGLYAYKKENPQNNPHKIPVSFYTSKEIEE